MTEQTWKVGDRIQLCGVVHRIDKSDEDFPLTVLFDGDQNRNDYWMPERALRNATRLARALVVGDQVVYDHIADVEYGTIVAIHKDNAWVAFENWSEVVRLNQLRLP